MGASSYSSYSHKITVLGSDALRQTEDSPRLTAMGEFVYVSN